MYLKSIELNGFKSFAQKTVLDFLPPHRSPKGEGGLKQSITAVVGPNGSGKSNVSDAILWVLGEQRMTQLRGKKNADVIFSGSEGKGEMGVASVSITFDNSDHRAPLEFDELIITRKLYRTGESEYIINGKKVRLLDLQILLAQAQFGQGSYSVVSQGMIDQMLLQTTQERKAFFDEASGIKEFQIKRHQAFLKLTRSKENIEQAELILNEISPRLRFLSRQVKKLEQRQSVEEELRELQEQYYLALLRHYSGDLKNLNTENEKIEKQYQSLNNELIKIQEELAELARSASRQEEFSLLQKKYQEVQQKKSNLESELAVIKGKMQIEYSRAGEHQVGWLQNKIESLDIDENKVEVELKEYNKQRTMINEHLLSSQKELESKELERTELKTKLTNLEHELNQVRHEQNYRQFTGLRAVEAVLKNRAKFGEVFGTVAQLGTVDTKYQTALDAAAGGHLSSIVTADDRVAEACIHYLRYERLGFATFLPINKIKPRAVAGDLEKYLDEKGVHGFAVNLVKHKEQFNDLFSYVLGSTLIVENIDVARRIGIGRVRMVTLDGDVLELSGSMKGGYRKKRLGDVSFANASLDGTEREAGEYEVEITEVSGKLESLEKEIFDLRESTRKLESQKEILAGKIELVQQKKQTLDTETASLKQELALNTMDKKGYGEIMKTVELEKSRLEDGIKKLDKDLQKAGEAVEKFNAQEEEKRQRVFSLQERMQKVQQELNDVVGKRNENRISIAKRETKLEDVEAELYQELHIISSALEERVELKITLENLDEIQAQVQKLKYKLSLIGGIDDEVVDEYEETKIRHEDLSLQLDDLHKTVEDLEELIAELDEVMRKKRAKAFKEIRKEFKRYFKILFEGGEADLMEVYSDEEVDSSGRTNLRNEYENTNYEQNKEVDVEEEKIKKKRGKKMLSGIEIKASPPGKKIKNIQALSGGERTMTSIALVCAILYTNPSPFVVLDEVEAALDEANTLRFTKILEELAEQSQFILITHNRATMHAADALYGVTMGGDGISKLVSVNLSMIHDSDNTTQS